MALTDLLFGAPIKAQVGVVQFDCSLSEGHTSDSEITDHPVELGGIISDHIRELPEELELNGVVSQTPIAILASLSAKSPVTDDFLPAADRVEAAYSKLRELKKNGDPLTVVTALRNYSNMLIKTIGISRDADTGNILNCTLSLREVKQASALAIDLPIPADVANKAAANAGKASKGAGSADQAAKSQSILSSLLGAL